jgi:hypothetical protein
MSTFEFNQREFRQSNTALRYQNRKLEDQVSRVTRVVFEEALQLLAAADLALDRASRTLPADKRGSLDESKTFWTGSVSIRESLRLIGGTLTIDSSPGGGTEVAITIGRNAEKRGPRTHSRN